jgi:hypothetical protein
MTLTAVFCVFIFAVIFLHYGILKKIEICETFKDGFILVYEPHHGDYGNIREKINLVYNFLKNNENLVSFKGFALFLDNPLYKKNKELKSLGGCVLPFEKKIENHLREKNISFFIFKGGKCVYSEFLYKGSFSHTLGLYKVYPKLFDFFKKIGKNPETLLEVYDIKEKKIKYYGIYEFKKKYFLSLFINREN